MRKKEQDEVADATFKQEKKGLEEARDARGEAMMTLISLITIRANSAPSK